MQHDCDFVVKCFQSPVKAETPVPLMTSSEGGVVIFSIQRINITPSRDVDFLEVATTVKLITSFSNS